MNVRMGKPTLDYYKCEVGEAVLIVRLKQVICFCIPIYWPGFGFIVIDYKGI